MTWRLAVLCVCLLFTGVYLGQAASAEPTPMRRSLKELPYDIGEWRGRPNANFSKDILAVLKVDDYVTRTYVAPDGAALGLYVGYHATQRQGASIHSPLNCLPGAGWTPASQDRAELEVTSGAGEPRRVTVNRVVIEKGVERQLVLYWYQSQGRVVASEYWGKFYSVVDAVRHNRTDAALVRVMVPVDASSPDGLAQSEREARAFVAQIFPLLTNYLPE